MSAYDPLADGSDDDAPVPAPAPATSAPAPWLAPAVPAPSAEEAAALNELENLAEAPSAGKGAEDPAAAAAAAAAALEAEKKEKRRKKREAAKKKKRAPLDKDTEVTSDRDVYVTGLPPDVTLEELAAFFAKCGVLRKDDDQRPKIKIYRNADGKPKGDCTVSYYKRESVPIALNILDGADLRIGVRLTVQPAVYTIKAGYQPDPKRRRAKPKVDQNEDLGWEEKEHFHVVLKHLFTPAEVLSDPNFVSELREDIEAEAKKCGDIEKITIFERNPDGVVVIKFCDTAAAEKCIQTMEGRFFAGQRVTASYYDGKSNYQVQETEAERQERIKKWEKDLGSDDEEEASHKAQPQPEAQLPPQQTTK